MLLMYIIRLLLLAVFLHVQYRRILDLAYPLLASASAKTSTADYGWTAPQGNTFTVEFPDSMGESRAQNQMRRRK
jgi:hypothetical protein